MTIAQKIIEDPKNSMNGEVQHHRIAEAADKIAIVVTGNRFACYRFADGSRLEVNHILGDYNVY